MSQSSQLTKVVGDIRILTLCLERLLFHKLYDTLIFKTRDERKNLHFRLKLYQLDWVTEQHLQVPIKIMSSPANVLKFCAAQETLREISTKTCPSSKLRTLSRCCRQLFSLLNETELGRPCSADDFLPLLIYLIIKTVPQDLHSTLAFINSFGRLIYTETGEWAYYLTNVNCAVEFIDKCQSKSFTLSDDEYFSNIEKSTSKVEKMMDEIRPSLEQLKITLKTNWESYARLKNMIHTKKELKF
ncbi:Rab5 GDP/GTP exchange factor [Thelohanellus kitauei]|uniref:Rab5 GDP/GTP exchange factor n=1 Tax=Thelohanellus kitauei TaxID=669202 RepID=A0A0C2JAD3_THEKT|nr:Rab5 GDP/GTP exchange factor [Thelohanellus kitauei]